MKTIRTYPKVCDSCKSTGVISEPFPSTTSITKMCPACSGSGVVIVTEVIETDELSALEKEVPEEKKCIVANHNFICDDKGITTCKDCHLTINYPFE
ncbi:MAG: hypothetical protein UR43_C0019G0010 [candidate division TM6 bacterium GW2011_GWF2_33_332]|nr:MAG: hypothetical protein UR43_C0019G0010 [candidate division TM6 bacterium GW2011_GWF2_33_332]